LEYGGGGKMGGHKWWLSSCLISIDEQDGSKEGKCEKDKIKGGLEKKITWIMEKMALALVAKVCPRARGWAFFAFSWDFLPLFQSHHERECGEKLAILKIKKNYKVEFNESLVVKKREREIWQK
jgi:hypothetical protein